MIYSDARCPRCHEGRLKTWVELDDEERLVVERLPQSVEAELQERIETRRWCTRCWYESERPGSGIA